MKTKTRIKLAAFIILLLGVIAFQTHTLIIASEIEVTAPEPVCSSLECEIDRRTISKFEENYGDNMESARLQVLSDMNKEMQAMVSNPEKRLNN